MLFPSIRKPTASDQLEKSDVPEFIEDKKPISVAPQTLSFDDLIKKAAPNRFEQADIARAAKIYQDRLNLFQPTVEQIERIEKRRAERIEKNKNGGS